MTSVPGFLDLSATMGGISHFEKREPIRCEVAGSVIPPNGSKGVFISRASRELSGSDVGVYRLDYFYFVELSKDPIG